MPTTCAHCGEPYELTRWDRRYCGDRCRRDAWREQRRKIERASGLDALRRDLTLLPPHAVGRVAKQVANILEANGIRRPRRRR